MTESDIRLTLSKIKMINKKFISYYYSETFANDNGLSGFHNINERYISSIKDAIGGYVNDVKSKRILKAIGFEQSDINRYLIPVNGIGLIKDNTEIISFTGDIKVVGKDCIDMDSRNGMLAYYIELAGVKK